jgi:hypothetical protein
VLLDAVLRQLEQRQHGRAVSTTGDDDRELRDRAVGDREFDAAQLAAVEAGRDGRVEHRTRAFDMREGADHLARRQLRQPPGLLLLGAGQRDRLRGEADRGEERHRRAAPARFLDQHRQIERGHPQPAMLLGQRRAEEAQLRQAAPQIRVIGRAFVEQLAQPFRRGQLGEHALRLLPQHILFFGQVEIHDFPSTRPIRRGSCIGAERHKHIDDNRGNLLAVRNTKSSLMELGNADPIP